jgi:hypothetical protein
VSRAVNWHARASRYRTMAVECRALAQQWPDPDIATSFSNAGSELETVADAMLERHRSR